MACTAPCGWGGVSPALGAPVAVPACAQNTPCWAKLGACGESARTAARGSSDSLLGGSRRALTVSPASPRVCSLPNAGSGRLLSGMRYAAPLLPVELWERASGGGRRGLCGGSAWRPRLGACVGRGGSGLPGGGAWRLRLGLAHRRVVRWRRRQLDVVVGDVRWRCVSSGDGGGGRGAPRRVALVWRRGPAVCLPVLLRRGGDVALGEPHDWAGGPPLGRGNVARAWVVACRSSLGHVRTELGWVLGCRGAGLAGSTTVGGGGAARGVCCGVAGAAC